MSVVTSEINLRYLCSSSLQIKVHVWCCSQQAIYNTHTQGTLRNFIIQHSICSCYNFLQIVCLPFCHLLWGIHRILSGWMTKKCHFPPLFLDLACRQKLCHHYLDYSANKKKILQMHFEFTYFYFIPVHLEL